ncbi:unnamed protein product [Hymenolepis diminuta]|uniref:Uncharacterized protein n=1 Tax=Hymenolepis diminuta TaxID=6216 RepID=A0A564Y1L9_HYMDI|nr:unnamed protein product [Hymenolepis diminuta]
MEMLDVAAGGQWTSLTTFSQRPRLIIYSMTKVGNELLIKTSDVPPSYSVELDGDPKRQHAKWRRREFVPVGKLITVHLK